MQSWLKLLSRQLYYEILSKKIELAQNFKNYIEIRFVIYVYTYHIIISGVVSKLLLQILNIYISNYLIYLSPNRSCVDQVNTLRISIVALTALYAVRRLQEGIRHY